MPAKRILIVDDEPDIIKTIGIALEAEGYDIITAMSAEEALDKVHSENPDLVILDVMLPKLLGNDAARILKSDEKYRHIPIILITALTQKGNEESLNDSSADCCIKKPFELGQLSDKISELLGLSKRNIY